VSWSTLAYTLTRADPLGSRSIQPRWRAWDDLDKATTSTVRVLRLPVRSAEPACTMPCTPHAETPASPRASDGRWSVEDALVEISRGSAPRPWGWVRWSPAGVVIRPLDSPVEVPSQLLVTPGEACLRALVAAFT
jgi:hypothetical protein